MNRGEKGGRGQQGRRRRRLPISIIDFHGIVQWSSHVQVDALTTTLHYADVHTLCWPLNLSQRSHSRLRFLSLSLFLFLSDLVEHPIARKLAAALNTGISSSPAARSRVLNSRITFIFFVADNRCTTHGCRCTRISVRGKIFCRVCPRTNEKKRTRIIRGRVKLFPTTHARRPTQFRAWHFAKIAKRHT